MPSGFAVTWTSSEVNAVTSTGRPDLAASAEALFSVGVDGAGVPACRAAAGGAAWPAVAEGTVSPAARTTTAMIDRVALISTPRCGRSEWCR
ncbi:hypothetical protein Cci01nite_20600 [Catellatospora citrea]|uniref:Uncharacterized protein n=1 Tax=Catellatospora citrea TaxID=53366 RepID=A0A8J3K5A0_9ACTN|nr:hypothetical protein Cci01nite_20600 [Catellatospora citrea]